MLRRQRVNGYIVVGDQKTARVVVPGSVSRAVEEFVADATHPDAFQKAIAWAEEPQHVEAG